MKITIYIAAIIIANILTSTVAPSNIAGIIVPAGSWLIGITFILRDWVQFSHGRAKTYMAILAALIASALAAMWMDQGLTIVLASAASFVISEGSDTEIYSRLKTPLHSRVLWSGVAGSVLDSVLFILIAGFPLEAIIGQLLIKIIMQVIGYAIIKALVVRTP